MAREEKERRNGKKEVKGVEVEMKKMAIPLLILMLVNLLVTSCSVLKITSPGYIDLTPEEVKAKIDEGGDFILLDVRELWEYAEGHLKGAKLIPLGEIEQRFQELDSDKEIIVYCRSGHRSVLASKKLVNLGFKKVKNMKGGILAWKWELVK